MADTETTVAFIDGATQTKQQLSVVDGAAQVAPQTALRANSALVSDAAPLPTRRPPALSVYSTVAEAAHVLSGVPCTLNALQVNPAATGWILLFDLATQPADGTVAPRKAWFFSANTQATFDKTFDPPLKMVTGAVVVVSSTGPFVLTAATGAQFSGEVT